MVWFKKLQERCVFSSNRVDVSPCSISDQRIASVAINSSGDWIGFGCSRKNLFLFTCVCVCARVSLLVLQSKTQKVNTSTISGMGQLLVWEWQSESYVFKQQGHFNNMASLAYSPDGQYIVTGGDDSKVSLRE